MIRRLRADSQSAPSSRKPTSRTIWLRADRLWTCRSTLQRLECFRFPCLLDVAHRTSLSASNDPPSVNEFLDYDVQKHEDQRLIKVHNVPHEHENGKDSRSASPAPHLYGRSDLGKFGHRTIPERMQRLSRPEFGRPDSWWEAGIIRGGYLRDWKSCSHSAAARA